MARTLHFGRWHFRLTATRYILILLTVIMLAAVVVRLIKGLGAVTNLSDEWPWGLWIGFDLLSGIALAGGGFSTALFVHVLHKQKYAPVARAALLTSLLGYLIACLSLFFDVGRWYNFWRPFFFWGYHSVLFEVFWCISLYTLVQIIEFGDIFFEKIKFPALKKVIHRAMPFLLILGIALPTLHQSSLGSLFIVAVGKLNPLWWSMFIPFFFVWSAFFLGPAMVTLEGTMASRAYKRESELPIYASLTKVTMWMLIIYLIIKIIDLNYRGVLSLAFNGSFESNMFLLEMIGTVTIPIIMYAIPSIRKTSWGVFTASFLVVAGVILNRANVCFVGMAKAAGASYYPSIWEWAVTLGLWSILVLGYCFIVENFSILPKEEHKTAPTRSAGAKLPFGV